MTKDELNRYRWLVKDIREIKDEIDELRAKAEKVNQSISDMPRVESGNGDKVSTYALRIAEKTKELKSKQTKAKSEREKIIDFLGGIDDVMVKLAIQYRFLNILPWVKVAYFLGGGNTAESARKMVNRYFYKK